MLKCPLIIGNKGGMGQRYSTILRHLGVDFLGVDFGEKIPTRFDSIIICTPTDQHCRDIRRAIKAGVPTLCEKPISTSLIEAIEVCDEAEASKLNLRMVNQYAQLDPRHESYATHYNYFKTGGDTLAWDCINILGLARNLVELYDDSPYWTCVLNGRKLSIAEIDGAYVSMIQDWLNEPTGNIPYIRHAHRAVQAYLEASTCAKS